MGIVASALILAAVAGCWPLVAAAAAIRRAEWVAVRPELVPTTADQLSPAAANVLAWSARPLAEEGFEPAASVHAPRFGSSFRWTQVLFVRRDEGTRASILAIAHTTGERAALFFATEFADGHNVRTEERDLPDWPMASPDGPAAAAGRVAAVLALHRQRVERAMANRRRAGLPPDPGRVVPAAGREGAWLADRAAGMAADVAGELGYWQAGAFYRPSWPAALGAAAPRVWPFRLVCRRPAAVVPAAAERGFDVLSAKRGPAERSPAPERS